MRRILIFLFCFSLGAAALAQELERETVAHAEISAYLTWWTSRSSEKVRARAFKHVASAAHWATFYKLDPLLVAERISGESSWNPRAIGFQRGEIGLMQLHSKGAKKGFDLTDPDQQVQAGCKWLRKCIDACHGNVKRGLNMYARGGCTKPAWKNLDYHWNAYQSAVKRFRNR